MSENDLIERYNYDEFIPEKFEPWMRFSSSPRLGSRGPDYPLWRIDETETTLGEVLALHVYTIVEFGSFT
jgi:hypothetical protein